MMVNQVFHYLKLMRLHRPIGILLFLWPTLWALWIASAGAPPLGLTLVFIAGVLLMRSAGCIINDVADRDFDGQVSRTKDRPLVSGTVSLKEALILLSILALLAANLLWFLNSATRWLTLPLVALTLCYPLMKRVTHLPQTVLGLTCNWGIPMAFTAITGQVPWVGWALFLAACLWSIAYDTIYAMVDREDDLQIGIKSTAILFKDWDTSLIGLFHMVMLSIFVTLGVVLHLSACYFIGLAAAAGIFVYEQRLIHDRNPSQCFRAFNLSHWAGFAIFFGLILAY